MFGFLLPSETPPPGLAKYHTFSVFFGTLPILEELVIDKNGQKLMVSLGAPLDYKVRKNHWVFI